MFDRRRPAFRTVLAAAAARCRQAHTIPGVSVEHAGNVACPADG
ncbi:hypothetical protein OHA77_28520 [Streptosporangium sp. NBC_01639]|nr:hypothetical protein [Streptosporangium sp. NBC_01756]WSC88729.1 hypothetical protein OIE48_11245 [Streptosporangium sp. NBC_01756]WTD52586.1 hypothetical protein OHA77_28520 [Streptosporangium sp. NBC_01639]